VIPDWLIRRALALTLGIGGGYTAHLIMSENAWAVGSSLGVDDTVWLAIVVAFSGTLSPVLLSYLTNRNRRAERKEDYDRQDAVAAQAAEAARLLAEQQTDIARKVRENAVMASRATEEVAAKADEAARLLLDENRKVADRADQTIEKLDIIHTLVNSNMTAAMKAEMDATVRELALMREIVAMKKTSGQEPSVETLAAIEATGAKIAELSASLSDRIEATKAAAKSGES
jgi:hypothetical protein